MGGLSDTQLEQFRRQGYLVVENLLDESTLSAIRGEYAALMDDLYDGWAADGMVPPCRPDMSF